MTKAFPLLVAFAIVIEAFGANAWVQNARKSPEWFTRGVMCQIQLPRIHARM